MHRAFSGPIRPVRRSSAPRLRPTSRAQVRCRTTRRRADRASLPPRCRRTVRRSRCGCAASAPAIGRALTCRCSRIALPDGSRSDPGRRDRTRRARPVARRACVSIAGGLRSAGCGIFGRRHASSMRRRPRLRFFAAQRRSLRSGSMRLADEALARPAMRRGDAARCVGPRRSPRQRSSDACCSPLLPKTTKSNRRQKPRSCRMRRRCCLRTRRRQRHDRGGTPGSARSFGDQWRN